MSAPNPNILIPTYIRNENQENYNEELNQALQNYLGPNGLPVAQITNAELINTYANRPNSTVWFVTDHVPPVFVGKINGALVQFVTAAYP